MDYEYDTRVVVAILEERSKDDPMLREVLRGAVLEAALIAATAEEAEDDAS